MSLVEDTEDGVMGSDGSELIELKLANSLGCLPPVAGKPRRDTFGKDIIGR